MRHVITALAMGAFGASAAQAEPVLLSAQRAQTYSASRSTPAYIPAQPQPHQAVAQRGAEVQYAAAEPAALGGGFIEFIFNGGRGAAPPRPPQAMAARGAPTEPIEAAPDARMQIDPQFQRQIVDYRGAEPAGTIVIDTPNRHLFLVQGNGTAVRYGIGVGKPGFAWAGEKKISAKKEWPDWTPPPEMLQRRPDLPHFMAGGPENPLGARAMYLGSSLYRIHGSNEPWTIGQAVSSGCIRMRNEDVVDLYERVKVGTRVLVI